MTPTPKSNEIEIVLTKIAGISRQDASKKRICAICRGDATQFRDLLSVQEYRISGMCQSCQDSVFG